MRKFKCITKQFNGGSPNVSVVVEAKDIVEACKKVVQVLGYEPFEIRVIEVKEER